MRPLVRLRRMKARDSVSHLARSRAPAIFAGLRQRRAGKQLVPGDPESWMSGVRFFRQEIHFVLCRETDHFGYIGQSMQVIEKGFQLAGWRNPEQGTDRLIGFIEIAMRNAARHAYEVSGLGLDPDAVELEVQRAFLHEDEFILRRMNMDRNK